MEIISVHLISVLVKFKLDRVGHVGKGGKCAVSGWWKYCVDISFMTDHELHYIEQNVKFWLKQEETLHLEDVHSFLLCNGLVHDYCTNKKAVKKQ